MITVAEAREIIKKHLYKPTPAKVDLTEAIGKVLDEDIIADRPLPPFDRVAMDGIAIRYSEWQQGRKRFAVHATQLAGAPAIEDTPDQACIEIMTGAMLPSNLDTVIRYEDVTFENGIASIEVDEIKSGQNVHKKGTDKPAGAILMPTGVLITPAEVGVMASVGKSQVSVKGWPEVAIIATGDELVDVAETPKPYQIRMSNVWCIQGELHQSGIQNKVFHLTDEKATLSKKLEEIMDQYPVIILSGGVSKGKADFVPEILEELGVKKHFHRVKQKPGKPFWFGTGPENYVFAFPGNPVSTFMCFYNYFQTWLRASFGFKTTEITAQLDSDFSFSAGLDYYLQVQCTWKEGRLWASPLPGKGSGDYANLIQSNAFMELPASKSEFKKGESYPILPFKKIA